MSRPADAPEVEQVERTEEVLAPPWMTILHNCECHTFEQVEDQLIKAIHCTLSRARAIAYEVHTKGQSIVYEGPRERCEAVADVLGSIGLLVKVTQ